MLGPAIAGQIGTKLDMTAEFCPATAMPDRDWWESLWPDPLGVVRSLGVKADMVVLDLCCGDGYFTAALARLVDGKVYGVNVDTAMLDRTKAEVERVQTSALDMISADARKLEGLLPREVDYVLMANTYHGVPDKVGLARGVAAVLKASGTFAVVIWHPIPRDHTVVLGKPRGPKTETRMSLEATRLAVEPAGFTLDRTVELPPFHYGTIF